MLAGTVILILLVVVVAVWHLNDATGPPPKRAPPMPAHLDDEESSPPKTKPRTWDRRYYIHDVGARDVRAAGRLPDWSQHFNTSRAAQTRDTADRTCAPCARSERSERNKAFLTRQTRNHPAAWHTRRFVTARISFFGAPLPSSRKPLGTPFIALIA